MAGTTPSQGIPYPERPDPFELTEDLRGAFNVVDSVFAQTRGESTAALTSAEQALVQAAQAIARANSIEEPVHVGPSEPTGDESLWVDTDDDAPGGGVTSEDITDASTVGRAVLTAPLSVDARNALSIFTGTRALLDAGTDTAERTWDAKELHEYVTDTAAEAGGAASWDDLTGKPTSFPPSAHTHDDRYYTEAEIDAQIAAAISGLTWSTGWQVVGNRDGVTGTISVSRSAAAGGDLTTVRLHDVIPPAGAGSIYLATLPAGFRHDGQHFFIASNRAAPRFSLLGVYGNSVAWVQLADGTVNHPTLPISGEYSWRSPDARPTI